MEIQRLFKLLKSITRQTNIRDATHALSSLLSKNFSGVSLIVYEIQSTRIDNSKTQCLVCLDCLGEAKPIFLGEDKSLFQAYSEKKDLYLEQGLTLDPKEQSSKILLPVVLYDKTVSHIITVEHHYTDTSERELLEGLLQIFTDVFRSLHEKGYDPLTRIRNRQAFDQVAADMAYSNNLDETDNQFSSIAILDIDKFKAINDKYGHAIGDETLVLFAQTIRSVLRQEDLFFRYGGEEFVILVRVVDLEQAYNVLERCRIAIETRKFPQVGHVTVSIGFADLTSNSHLSIDLSKADKALYYSKNNGRNQVQSYEELLEEKLLSAVKEIEGEIDFWD